MKSIQEIEDECWEEEDGEKTLYKITDIGHRLIVHDSDVKARDINYNCAEYCGDFAIFSVECSVEKEDVDIGQAVINVTDITGSDVPDSEKLSALVNIVLENKENAMKLLDECKALRGEVLDWTLYKIAETCDGEDEDEEGNVAGRLRELAEIICIFYKSSISKIFVDENLPEWIQELYEN